MTDDSVGPTRPARASPSRRTARALVLAGGGARAAYEVGVLSAIAERAPELEFPILTGVSAGAINAVYLATHPGPLPAAVGALRAQWSRLVVDRVYRVRPMALLGSLTRGLAHAVLGRRDGTAAVHGLLDMGPLRRVLEATLDFAEIDAKIAAGRLRAAALSATAYPGGETVTFVHGPPDAPTWRRASRYAVRDRLSLRHVLASAALPILFPAVRIGDGYYGDGSVRQTAPLAPAIHLGAQAILVVTQRGAPEPGGSAPPPRRDYPTLAEVIGLLLHAIFLDALEADAERLQRVNRLLARLPDAAGPDGLRPVQLLLLRPSRDLGALALGSGAKLPPLIRWLVRGMGGDRATAVDFLSYLLFDPAYTSALIELGYADARADWARIEQFLATTGG
jgi:NTE family protein